MESPKLKRLRELRELAASGRIDPKKAPGMQFADTDGTMVRLSDPGAAAALDRRIAEEEAKQEQA